MRIVAFSDWRVQPIDRLIETIGSIKDIDLIIYGGDDLGRFDNSNFFKMIESKLIIKIDKFKSQIIGNRYNNIIFHFFQEPTIDKSDNELREMAISNIRNNKCEIDRFVEKQVIRSPFKPSKNQIEAMKYELILGIQSGKIIEINCQKVIIFKIGRNDSYFPELESKNIFSYLSQIADAPVFGVCGNDDNENNAMVLSGPNTSNIFLNPQEFGEYRFIGIQGAICDEESIKRRRLRIELLQLRNQIYEFYSSSLLKKYQRKDNFQSYLLQLHEMEHSLKDETIQANTEISLMLSKVKKESRKKLNELLNQYSSNYIELNNIDDQCLPCIGHIVISETEVGNHLEIESHRGNKKQIIVSHTPPNGILDIGRRFGIHHCGSKVLKEHIENNNVPLVICGHIHGYGGYHEVSGKTTIVNASSHDQSNSPGNIAIIEIENDNIDIEWIKVSNFEGSIRRIKDIGIVRHMLLVNNGISTIDELAKCKKEQIMGFKTRFISPFELEKILTYASDDLESLIMKLLFQYNLSDNEMRRLNPAYIDHENQAIHFRQRRGKKDDRWIFLDLKTYSQIKDCIDKRKYSNREPLFFHSEKDRMAIEKLLLRITRVPKLSKYMFEPISGIGKKLGEELILKAKSIMENEPLILKRDKFSKEIVYVDIETSPIGIESAGSLGEFYIFLIGVYDEINGYQSFITKERTPDEKGILNDFINYLKNLPYEHPVLCAYNGDLFDFRHIKDNLKKRKIRSRKYQRMKKMDLLKICRKNTFLPQGFSLKNAATSFGYEFNDPVKSGYHIGLTYQGFILGTLDEPDWDRIIDNNRDDVFAMKHIVDRIGE